MLRKSPLFICLAIGFLYMEQGALASTTVTAQTGSSIQLSGTAKVHSRHSALALSNSAQATPVAAKFVATPSPTPLENSYSRFAVGVGYPDLRARVSLIHGLDLEAKVALASGEQAYSGRLYINPISLGSVDFDLGGEGGFLNFNGIDTISGHGSYGEPFVGVEYRFSKQWRITVDIGPALINVDSGGTSVSEWEWTYNTALYVWLF
jgi:hypothetical protein